MLTVGKSRYNWGNTNLIASLVLPLPYSQAATTQLLAWKRQRVILAAPALWNYKVTTVLRKALLTGYLPPEHLDFALDKIWRINIQDMPATLELQQKSLA